MRILQSIVLPAILILSLPALAQIPPVSGGMTRGAFSSARIEGRWGVKVWSNRLLDISPREFGRCSAHPKHPVVVCGSADGYFRALHKDNGELIWTFKTSAALRAAPAFHGDQVILAAADGCLHTLDVRDGSAIWKKPYCVDNPIWGDPVVTPDIIYFSVLGNQVYAIGREDGRLRFKVQRDRPQAMSSEGISEPVIDGDVLYSAFSDGVLVASNRFNGRELWHQDLTDDSNGPTDADSTPVVKDGVVFSGAFSAGPVALKASDGTILWKGRRFGVDQPVIFGRLLIVADAEGFVTAFNRADGTESWTTKLDTPAAWNPILVEDMLVVGGDRGLWLLRPSDGKVLSRTALPFGVTTEPGVDRLDLYFPAPGGTVNKAALVR
ncbi:MAG TPA: PQQ-binding-like beta-propeller repeat protein [Myxococcota bacterium]|nr:PQQ-binding-like beta-propeller repeat protein [Myxococcota bacterium]HPV04931.1 PQQ-binding-like beta-propeller repeat protein [Myxococcota bacterium]